VNSSSDEINRALASLAGTTALAAGDYQIGPEDLLQITLYNVDADTRTPRVVSLRVSQQGMISLPLIGDVKVSGLSPSGLEKELQKKYEKYIYNPQVGVLVADYKQQISLIGAVAKAGPMPLTGPKTVIEILANAGGVTDKAGTQVHIYRQGPNGRETHVIDLTVLTDNASFINASNAGLINMPVQPGDIINVPVAGTFFVDGAVRSPGAYPLGRRYTLTQALLAAGGIDREMSSSDVMIFRRKGSGGELQSLAFNFDEISTGSAVDPQVAADDVIVVPISTAKYLWNKYLYSIVLGGVSIRSLVPAAGS
jgi:polysaccharide export outer membrane protein